jgi:hypothetical protein
VDFCPAYLALDKQLISSHIFLLRNLKFTSVYSFEISCFSGGEGLKIPKNYAGTVVSQRQFSRTELFERTSTEIAIGISSFTLQLVVQ